MIRLLAAVLIACTGVQLTAHAHENMPASLIVKEIQKGDFDVQWRQPRTQSIVSQVQPVFPPDCKAKTEVVTQRENNTQLSEWRITCEKGLVANDSIIEFDGLPLVLFDSVISVTYLDQPEVNAVAKPKRPFVSLEQKSSAGPEVSAYLQLGVEHILAGFDHLLFVFCLVLLSGSLRALAQTVTAFTVAHSITLTLSSLKILTISGPAVEAMIALSILYLAKELLLKPEQSSLLKTRPWLMAFVFGLLHGFGFAGVLSEIGLPSDSILSALLLFNIGVELGQFAFILMVYPVVKWMRMDSPFKPASLRKQTIQQLPVYAVGGIAGYWWVARLLAMFA